jgi:PAS domain-containing protein
MLETIREYAAERLEASGDPEDMHRRHADYLCVFAEDTGGLYEKGAQPVASERLAQELDNFRAAIDWSLQHQRFSAVLRFGAALSLPIAVVDPEGQIVFYNKAGEAFLGDTFEGAREFSSKQWAAVFRPEREDGTPIPLHELPGGVALLERRADTMTLFYTGIDGVRRQVAATGFPLVGREGELFGAFLIFWHI